MIDLLIMGLIAAFCAVSVGLAAVCQQDIED
jgi:hypothetical protein